MALAVAMLLLQACGSGGTDSPIIEPPVPGSFTLTVGAPAPSTVEQGATGSANVTIARSGSFSGAVALVLEGVPNNVTAVVTAPTLGVGVTSTTLTIDVAIAVAPGTYPITVRASATGQVDRTATLNLVVVQRPVQMSIVRSDASTLSVNQGGTPINFNVVLSRDEVMTDVTLDVASGLPPGVTAAFAPAVLPTGGASTVTLTAGTSAVPGSYTVVVRASATGVTPATVSVPFTVLAPAGLELVPSQSALSVVQNGSNGVLVTVVRNNFTGVFTLEATGVPADVVVSYVRSGSNSLAYTVQFTVGGAAVPGTYPVVLTAAAAGAQSAPTTLTLTITAAPTGGSVGFAFCGRPSDVPIWFGIARSSRNWTRILPDGDNTFRFDSASATDVAWVLERAPDDFEIRVITSQAGDVTPFAGVYCSAVPTRSATGLLAGLGLSDLATVALGPSRVITSLAIGGAGFDLLGVPDGPQDLLATRTPVGGGATAVDRILLQRGINPANGASVGTLDFGGPGALIPEPYAISVAGAAAGESPSTSARLTTAGGASVLVSGTILAESATYGALPPAQRVAGDMYLLSGQALRTSGGTTLRAVSRWVSTPISTTLTLLPLPADPDVRVFASDGTYSRYDTEFTVQTEQKNLFLSSLTQESGAMRRAVSMTYVPRSTSNPSTLRLTTPVFEGASGWNRDWEMRVALPVSWTAFASGWNSPGGTVAPMLDGSVSYSYTRTGVLAAP